MSASAGDDASAVVTGRPSRPAEAADPLGAQLVRESALATWLAAPRRLREDANAEEDAVVGPYRDRAVVELAQNAADAASEAGERGRLLLAIEDDPDGGSTLVAANTGAPLTADGVAALASLRASSKSLGPPSGGRRQEGRRGDGPADADSTRADSDQPPAARRTMVGRFGVGFAAVRALSDEILVASRSGSVRFSLDIAHRTLQEAATRSSALAEVLADRGESLPILRLPFGVEGAEPAAPMADHLASSHDLLQADFDTVVRARLRGPAERAAAISMLDAVGDPLLIALPGLRSVTVRTPFSERQLADVEDRWLIVRSSGEHSSALVEGERLEDRRGARSWDVAWALPRATVGEPVPTADPFGDVERDGAGSGDVTVSAGRWPSVVHAPTPTDEPCTLPALLLGTFPVDPGRRRLAPGMVLEAMIGHAADAYAGLAREAAAAGGRIWALAPTGLAGSDVDARLRATAVERMAQEPLLVPVSGAVDSRPVDDGAPPDEARDEGEVENDGRAQESRQPEAHAEGVRIAPARAWSLAGEAGADAVLASALALPGLICVDRAARSAARALGVDERALASVLEELPAVHNPPWWRGVYAAVERYAAEPDVAEALATIPVPLATGGLSRGARGLLAPHELGPGIDAAAAVLAPHGLRVVHEDAWHPLLERSGASVRGPRALLRHESVRSAVAELALGYGEPRLEKAIRDVVRAAVADGLDPEQAPSWLREVPVLDDAGQMRPVGRVVAPGSMAERIFPRAPVLSAEAAGRWGESALAALGVRTGLRTRRMADVVVSGDGELSSREDLDVVEGWEEYVSALADLLGEGAHVGELHVVEGLAEVDPSLLPQLVRDLAAEPVLRAALLTPARSDSGRSAPSYTAWWLRDAFGAPFAARAERVAFLPPLPAGLEDVDEEVLAALGAVASLGDLDGLGWDAVLDGLPEAGHEVALAEAAQLWRELARAAHAGLALPYPPERLPVLDGSRARVWDAGDVVVADAMSGQLGPHLPAPSASTAALAAMLDVEDAAERADGAQSADLGAGPGGSGVELAIPEGVLLWCAAMSARVAPTWWRHESLHVSEQPVSWWREGRSVHAIGEEAAAAAIADAAGVLALAPMVLDLWDGAEPEATLAAAAYV